MQILPLAHNGNFRQKPFESGCIGSRPNLLHHDMVHEIPAFSNQTAFFKLQTSCAISAKRSDHHAVR
jgi:hypothetical protein